MVLGKKCHRRIHSITTGNKTVFLRSTEGKSLKNLKYLRSKFFSSFFLMLDFFFPYFSFVFLWFTGYGQTIRNFFWGSAVARRGSLPYFRLRFAALLPSCCSSNVPMSLKWFTISIIMIHTITSHSVVFHTLTPLLLDYLIPFLHNKTFILKLKNIQ